MKRNYMGILFSIVLVTALTACNNNNNDNDNSSPDNMNQNNDNISSLSTNQSSADYPQTTPIQTQEAKYKFQQVPQGQAPSPNTGTNNNLANPNQQQGQAQPPKQQQANPNHALSNFESDVVTLTNKERTQAGVPALQIDPQLSGVAREKSNDMQRKGYFSHTSPTYGSPFDMMRDFGITYKAAGENIAQGQTSPADVVNAWMNSEGHRANILNPNFTHIGVGYDPEGQHWTQMFIKK